MSEQNNSAPELIIFLHENEQEHLDLMKPSLFQLAGIAIARAFTDEYCEMTSTDGTIELWNSERKKVLMTCSLRIVGAHFKNGDDRLIDPFDEEMASLLKKVKENQVAGTIHFLDGDRGSGGVNDGVEDMTAILTNLVNTNKLPTRFFGISSGSYSSGDLVRAGLTDQYRELFTDVGKPLMGDKSISVKGQRVTLSKLMADFITREIKPQIFPKEENS